MKVITSKAVRDTVKAAYPRETLKAASAAVAERCQVSPRTVRCYMSGERQPSRLFSSMFAEQFGPLPESAWVDYSRRLPVGDARSAREAHELGDTRREAIKLQRAVNRMCMYCSAAETIAEATCWDSTCPLRSVSLAPLRADAFKGKIQTPKVWE